MAREKEDIITASREDIQLDKRYLEFAELSKSFKMKSEKIILI